MCMSNHWKTWMEPAHDTRAPKNFLLEFSLDQERDDDCEQRDSFDERRENDRARLETSCHFRLTRHAVHRLTGKPADTDARPNHGDAGADSCAELRPRSGVVLVE